MTEEQRLLRDAARRLVEAIELYVPSSTIHWAVEDARRAAAALARETHTVHTTDKEN